jgi:hypothetical protein
MLTDECEFACCYEVAGLYTKRFLAAVREATLASLGANPDANTILRQGFGGKATTLAEVEALAPRDLYVWITCDAIKSVPEKYCYSKIEILDVRNVSPDAIECVTRMSGVKAEPGMSEEAFSRFVREDGQWRIDQ